MQFVGEKFRIRSARLDWDDTMQMAHETLLLCSLLTTCSEVFACEWLQR